MVGHVGLVVTAEARVALQQIRCTLNQCFRINVSAIRLGQQTSRILVVLNNQRYPRSCRSRVQAQGPIHNLISIRHAACLGNIPQLCAVIGGKVELIPGVIDDGNAPKPRHQCIVWRVVDCLIRNQAVRCPRALR